MTTYFFVSYSSGFPMKKCSEVSFYFFLRYYKQQILEQTVPLYYFRAKDILECKYP